jgi:D-3-phosphoglycerate dehydrogenase
MAEEIKKALSDLGNVSWGPFSHRELDFAVSDCEVLMVRLGRHIGKALLGRAPKLKFIVTATTGLDHVDLDAALTAGVRVISLRDCPEAIQDVSATAEHTLGLLLALLRRIPAAASHVLAGGWNRNLFWGSQLRGKRLGIVGYGRIGKMLAHYGAALGMEVMAFDRDLAMITWPATPLSFEELLESCDIISVHVSAVPENRHLFDQAAISRIKPGGILVNTARGAIVQENALVAAISSGQLAGAAVDVLDGEELRDTESSPLLACARAGYNVLITPHIGGATKESITRTECAVINVLAAKLSEPGC